MSVPPLPGEDPEFDRLVEAEMARRAQERGQQQPAKASPLPPRFEDDVQNEMNKLEGYFKSQVKPVRSIELLDGVVLLCHYSTPRRQCTSR